ncbi:hypothetical protein [Curtobacterium sp. VKM Ac-1376]|uniref:hypothetical protein n=1 Tax=Curtobacterium sp. VKM Ac-1376 TaxID=123312 RepID=UPI00188CC8B4|nr:hypothetical protein [Curtobacterium sp. VKM Ac-1376]MBF4613782.1 hypothetical protein [Curtobacterium sp. VKM Ac-1376]
MDSYRAKAEHLAKAAEETGPGLAAIAYAILALGEERSGQADTWHQLDDYDGLPFQLEQDYIFEYEDGEQVKWRLSADNPSSVHTFYAPADPSRWIDPNDLVDQCTRWRWA